MDKPKSITVIGVFLILTTIPYFCLSFLLINERQELIAALAFVFAVYTLVSAILFLTLLKPSRTMVQVSLWIQLILYTFYIGTDVFPTIRYVRYMSRIKNTPSIRLDPIGLIIFICKVILLTFPFILAIKKVRSIKVIDYFDNLQK